MIQNFVLENFPHFYGSERLEFSIKTNRMTLYPTVMEVLVSEPSFFFFLLEIRLRLNLISHNLIKSDINF